MFRVTIAVCLAMAATTTWSFSPAAFVRTTQSRSSSSLVSSPESSKTALHISSWGSKGPPSRWADTLDRANPADKVQAYLKEPQAVEARSNIDGVCLVSGLIQPESVTSEDQFLFDLLNHQDSAFEFTKIVAFVPDAKLAKKRLISRSARYTGLLDKLDFVQAPAEGGDRLPTVENLNGVKSWLACLEAKSGSPNDVLDHVGVIAERAQQATSVENVAILLTNANELDVAACQAALDKLKAAKQARDGKLAYTIVAVGKLTELPEGKEAYHYGEFGTQNGTLPAKAIFSRQESYRMITELLQLECGVDKALSFAEIYNVNATEVKLIKGLREAGYARPQEIDHMVREGPAAYEKAIEDFKTRNPDWEKGYTTNAWWEAEQFQKSRRRSDERVAREEQKVKDVRTLDIEAIAKEWVKREYFRQSMAGTIENDMTEEQFRETVWERAMLEGDLKYRQKIGENVDEEAELADFKKRQERKQKEMLKKAKKELQDVLGEPLDLPEDNDDKKKKD